MKFKRTILIFALVLVLTFVLTACSTGRSDAPEPPPSPSSEETTDETASESESGQAEPSSKLSSEPSDPAQTDDSILVAYFSHTGNTEAVAGQIADLTGGTLAKIQRAEEYGDLQKEAEAEILDGVHPEITVSVDNVENYDTIFVGYPIWWNEAPAMIATFLDSYDFSGKTIIPFCISASDSIDNSLHIFNELCPDAVIAKGLTANDAKDIEPWLQELGLVLSSAPAETETDAESAAAEDAVSGSNILIAYFSVPETDGVDTVAGASRVVVDGEILGNNQYIAQLIQEETGGDLFRIETVQEYPGSHEPLLEFAYNELSEDARPELAAQIKNPDSYDVIFLGYPNWNADLPMPLYTFLEEYDFGGKTIIPFTTHGGSGFSRTIQTIQELQPEASVISDGLSISRNSVPEAQDDVAEWVTELGI